MSCTQFGGSVEAGREFSGDCGSAQPLRCAVCGSGNPAGKRYCGDCGAGLRNVPADVREVTAPTNIAPVPERHSRSVMYAERRELTVMFVDLVGSSALGATLDPEELRDVMIAYQNCVAGVVARFDGFIARYMGDGILVYFGYPRAHEDDAERAVRAGLAVVDAVSRLSLAASAASSFGIRVGIATGLAVVGDLIGSGSSSESAAVGDTPNLAACLQTMAEPGTVLIAATTRHAVGDLFELRTLKPANWKGRTAPVQAWLVLGEGLIDNRFEALCAANIPLVNRAEEIELLLRRWVLAKAGDGRVVLVAGAPGIGKSRLVAEFGHIIEAQAQAQYRLFCSAQYQGTPLHPFIRHFERAAGFRPSDSSDVRLVKLQQFLARSSSTAAEVALIADLLGIPGGTGVDLEHAEAQHSKQLTAAIVRQFEELVETGPILVVIEDSHWADSATLDLLDVLIDEAEHWPILLIVTMRPEALPSWVGRAHVSLHFLNALDHGQAVSLVRYIAGDHILPTNIIDRIVAQADGVPLFLQEITKSTLEMEALHSNSGNPTIDPLSSDPVPASLRRSLMARLDRLSTGKEIAGIASVIGREFSFEMVQRLSGLPTEELERALADLVQTGLVIARGRGAAATYNFKFALLQSAIYMSLLHSRRRAIHARLADLLEENESGRTPAKQLAWDFAQSGAADGS